MNVKTMKFPIFNTVMYVIAYVLNVLVVLSLSYLIDSIILVEKFELIKYWLLIVLPLTFVANFLSYKYNGLVLFKKSFQYSKLLASDLIKRLFQMVNKKYEEKDKAYYINVLTSSVGVAGDIYVQKNIQFVATIIVILGILAVVFSWNIYFGLAFLLYIPVIILSGNANNKNVIKFQKDYMQKRDYFISATYSIIDSKKSINILKQEEFFSERFSKVNEESIDYIYKYKTSMFLNEQLPKIVNNIYNILFLVLGAYLISKKSLLIGELIVGYQLLNFISEPVSTLTYIMINIKSSKEHLDRINEFYLDESFYKKEEGKLKESSFMLKAKTFNLTIKKGDLVHELFTTNDVEIGKQGLYIIKGGNGTGKTTLINYILGYLDSHYGTGEFEITNDINEYSYLSYPTLLVNGSFNENMFGIKIDGYIKQLLNIDFEERIINNNPINLSLGQIQKLSLLRVLSQKSKYLFLDEPFSNLDSATIGNLKEYINKIKDEKTVVIIMHDTSLDSAADMILKISNKTLEKVK